ncbi:hypothetical protein TDB9533_01331 [Thalassocella blandensis]|nr:hypothetical protein TDB9533_01331 [Thalassocella blandensis]
MKKVTLTSTSFIRHDFSVDNLLENLHTVLAKNADEKTRVDRIVVVNEYSVNNIRNEVALKNKVENALEECIFYQKKFEEYGQENSLNILKQHIDPFQFQVHWEEGWKCTAAFLDDAIDYMETSSVSQLGLTNDYIEDKDRLGDIENFRRISVQHLKQLPEFEDINLSEFLDESRWNVLLSRLQRFRGNLWPLYSLRPCVNRVSFTQNLPAFNTHEKLWPVLFELLYAFSWVNEGGSRACLIPHVSEYSDNYKSTWRGKKSSGQKPFI